MSTRRNNGTHYENHQRAAELQDPGAHAHRSAIQHGQEEHLTPAELSRRELESAKTTAGGHSLHTFSHADTEKLAYEFWQERGCPEGSPDEDWFRATKELRSRNIAH
jgi:hypothetical protein